MISKKLFLVILITYTYLFSHAFAMVINQDQDVQKTLQRVYEKYKNLETGNNANYIPELGRVNPHYFGIAIATPDGKMLTIGDTDVPFAIESLSKLFSYGLAQEDNGEAFISSKIGLNSTGHPFNSLMEIEEKPNHLHNPFVNAGAIQITSTIKGANSDQKWQRVFNKMQEFSDGKLTFGEAVYQSESATNQRNRALGELLAAYQLMFSEPLDAVDRYTKACSVMLNVKQLALMGATLANHGVNSVTHKSVLAPEFVRNILSEMVVNGLYENSGAWWFNVGIPAKSGVGGGMIAVIPGKLAIAVYSPRLDEAHNSVRGQAVIKELAQTWNLHLLG